MFECVLFEEDKDNVSHEGPSGSAQQSTNENEQNLLTEEIDIKDEPTDLEISGGQHINESTWNNQDFSDVPNVQQQQAIMDLRNISESWQSSREQYAETHHQGLPPSFPYRSLSSGHLLIHPGGTKVTTPIVCEICHEHFQSQSMLKNHIDTSHGSLRPVVYLQRTELTCFSCNSGFTTNFHLQQHIETVHNENRKTNTRTVPPQSRSNKSEQQNRALSTLPKCHICQAMFMTSNELQEHVKLHMEIENIQEKKNFTCHVCHLKLKSKLEMMKHMISTHCDEESDNESELISCSDCDFKCPTESEMYAHSSFHNVFKYKCQYCEINIISKNQLDKHISISHKVSTTTTTTTTSHITTSKRKAQQNTERNKKFKTSNSKTPTNNETSYNTSSVVFESHEQKIEQVFIKSESSNNSNENQIQALINNLICNLCNESFSIKKSLYLHTETQHNDVIVEQKIIVRRGKESNGEYKCDLCTTSFTMFDYLIDHKFKHRGIKPYSCKFCCKHFPTNKTISTHYKQYHESELRLEISKLEQITSSTTNKDDEEFDRSEVDENYMKPTLADKLSKRKMVTVCSICRVRYPKMSELYKHCVEKHQDSKQTLTIKYNQKGGGPIKCNECGLGFMDVYTQRHHLMRHFKIRPYMCKYCGKLYSSPASIHEHFTKLHNQDLIRDGLKPLKPRSSESRKGRYPTFSKGFVKRQEKGQTLKPKLEKSKSGVNTADSWYSTKVECDICKVTVAHKTQLEKHMKSFHFSEFINNSPSIQVQDKHLLSKDNVIVYSFICNLCKKGFYRKTVLHTHALQSHEVVKKSVHETTPFVGGKFKCNDCKYSFKKSELLIDHTFKHRGIQPYACTYCDACFGTRSSLYKHLKTLHPGYKRFTVVSAMRHINKIKNNRGDEEETTSNVISASTCNYCDQDFLSFDILNEHLKKIHEIVTELNKDSQKENTTEQPYDQFKIDKFCNCGKSFKSGTELKLHLQKCSISNRSCKYCGSIHLDDYSLHFHYWSVHNQDRYEDGYRLTNIKKSIPSINTSADTNQLTCEFCKQTYSNLSLLKTHIQRNHLNSKCDKMNLSNMFNYCNLCHIEFKNFRLLFAHAIKYHEICRKEIKVPDRTYGKYSCNVCTRRFTHSIRRDEHLLLHRNISRYYCKLCSKSVHFKTTFSNHFWLHHREKKFKKQIKNKTQSISQNYTCSICSENFNNKTKLRTHIIIKHLKISYECKFCPEIFLTQQKFKSHCCDIGKYPIVCCHCSKRFKTKKLLSEHRLKTHKRELTCNICNKNFISLVTLKSHQRTYHGEEHLLCNECGAKFSARHRLESHMKLHSEMKHPCDACSRVFWDHRQLQHHRNMEHKEKRYICHICNRALSQKWHYKAHMDAHAGIKKYGCDQCGLKYSTWKAQSVHMKKKHPELCNKK